MTARTIAVLAAAGLLGAARAGADEMQQPKSSSPSQQEREARAESRARESQAASSAAATSAQRQAAAGASKQGQESAIAGKLADVSSDTLTVKTDDGRSVTLRVTGSTQVTVDGRERSIGDLREGEQVRASYDATSGDKTATRIEATR
jgi:colicin import membrane protein